MRKINVGVELNDLYRLLIADCRYGYTRNNHLMPYSAFEVCKKYLPLMLVKDSEYALRTATQLCEECINELETYFYMGNDDENGNRASYIAFIKWLLKFLITNYADFDERSIYNIDKFYRNLSEDKRKKYIVYDGETHEELTGVLDKEEYFQFLYSQAQLGEPDNAILSYRLREEGPVKVYSVLRGLDTVLKEFRVVNLDYVDKRVADE